ncbi:unnamed protein product [Trifolium pratense]|uniref:Uncharacterized protein n=1 Tax=Trifolium pratense TaxID=57577 RepID=A0ACB0IL86_TRIPR|nr:unnamed protein product [Trifolium pratense]
MVQRLCLMASHTYPPGLAFPTTHHIKDSQTFLPSSLAKPDMLSYQCPFLKPSPSPESMKTQNKWFDDNQFVNADFSAQWPVSTDVQVLLGFGIVEQCTKHDKISKHLKSGTAESRIDGANISLMSDLMKLQLSAIDEPRQPFSSDSSSLLYLNDKFDIQKPLLYFLQDSALTSKITVHLDGQITFMGTEIQMKDLLSVVAESYLSKSLHKVEKHSLLVPHFGRVKINEAEGLNHSSTVKQTLTAPLRSPKKVKNKPSQKKNKKIDRERDLYKNYSHACESLLSLMVNKKKRRKTIIASLKKSGPELPELLTQISAGIAGTGLAVLLSVICKLACGRLLLSASSLFNTGLGFGLVWLSWSVSKLRATIVSISRHAAKLGWKEEEMIQKLDKRIRDIYFGSAALLALAVLSIG